MTFTDFIIESMAEKDNVVQALLIWRREDGSIGYNAFNQEMADSLGMLRFAAVALENDLVKGWREE